MLTCVHAFVLSQSLHCPSRVRVLSAHSRRSMSSHPLPIHSSPLLVYFFNSSATVPVPVPVILSTISSSLFSPPTIGILPYHPITTIPNTALSALNTNATMPFAVNPSGNGGTLLFAPVKSIKSTVFPAALPDVGEFVRAQVSKCEDGIERSFGESRGLADGERSVLLGLEEIGAKLFWVWSSRGASIIVAMRPESTCHSMWQWKSQTCRRRG